MNLHEPDRLTSAEAAAMWVVGLCAIGVMALIVCAWAVFF